MMVSCKLLSLPKNTTIPSPDVVRVICLFFILFLWLTPVLTASLLVIYTGLSLYIRIGIYFEERKLMREFGEQYAAYRAVTPMLFPAPKFFRNNWLSRFVIKQHSPDKV